MMSVLLEALMLLPNRKAWFEGDFALLVTVLDRVYCLGGLGFRF